MPHADPESMAWYFQASSLREKIGDAGSCVKVFWFMEIAGDDCLDFSGLLPYPLVE